MTPAIASSAVEFNETPGLFQGFIEKRTKRQLDLTVKGKTYSMTCKSMLVSRLPLPEGGNWYTYLSSDMELFPSSSLTHEWVKSFAVSRDEKGLIFK